MQHLQYLPYGEDWMKCNRFDPIDTTRLGIYRFTLNLEQEKYIEISWL